MTVRRNERPPAPRPPRARPTQVVIVHDLQEGDYLPDYGSTVRAVDVRTERLGIEWVDLQLTDQRQLTLDGHNDIAGNHSQFAGETDKPVAALITDLAQRGLLDETLIVWGGEFGRTVYAQGGLNMEKYGRDHHPRCFSMWLAGGGIKGGTTYGTTDDFSFNVVENPVPVYDLHATMLHCLGIDHEKLTFKFQGRHYRLTDVHGNVVKGLLA